MKRRIGNLKGIDIVEGDINIVNDSEVHISKLLGLYAKDNDFCWLVMPVDNLELKGKANNNTKMISSFPIEGQTSLVIVDLLNKQYIFSNIPKDINAVPVEFNGDSVIIKSFEYIRLAFVYTNLGIKRILDDDSIEYIGPCGPLIGLEGFISVKDKIIKFE